MKTKWRKVGKNRWARGPQRVWYSGYVGKYVSGVMVGRTLTYADGWWYSTPEAAMRAADEWAAKIAKALQKLEGDKTRRKP